MVAFHQELLGNSWPWLEEMAVRYPNDSSLVNDLVDILAMTSQPHGVGGRRLRRIHIILLSSTWSQSVASSLFQGLAQAFHGGACPALETLTVNFTLEPWTSDWDHRHSTALLTQSLANRAVGKMGVDYDDNGGYGGVVRGYDYDDASFGVEDYLDDCDDDYGFGGGDYLDYDDDDDEGAVY